MSSTTIHTFDDVLLTKEGTLIICDIDDTLFRYERNLNYFYKNLKHSFPELTEDELTSHASNIYATYVKNRKPSPTDYDGFIRLMKKVLETKSKLIFLTSRNECSKEYTQREFKHIGICYTYFNVYYTNNEITKGQFIRDKLDMDGITDLIVIDDQMNNIKSMKQHFPIAQCYRFLYKLSNE
jgi:hypothetical protein